jgi:biotin transporter BioY
MRDSDEFIFLAGHLGTVSRGFFTASTFDLSDAVRRPVVRGHRCAYNPTAGYLAPGARE